MYDDRLIQDTGSQAAAAAEATRRSVVLMAGDGIGPEIVDAARRVLSAACPAIDWIEAEGGSKIMQQGSATGLPSETIEAIEQAGVVLKGPMATPIGYGGKSANVTIRKMFELYANVRPITMLPNVDTPFKGRDIDFTLVRENVEDLYAGVEHMQTPDVAQCLKLITRHGSAKIMSLAFELARAEGRQSIHCVTKSNIMKLTEGLFQRVFEETAQHYPGLKAEHMLVDNCAQQMVIRPEQFETLVMTNMNGDILSDLAAGLVGGVGLAPSANLGTSAAMFEAVHGSADQIAGKGVANPTALILAGAMMLRHIGHPAAAERVKAAIRTVYAEGRILTADVAQNGQGASTSAFADAVLEAHGALAQDEVAEGGSVMVPEVVLADTASPLVPLNRTFDGFDLFVEWAGDANDLAVILTGLAEDTPFRLGMISNRGAIMWPVAGPRTETVAHWRCRFRVEADATLAESAIPEMLTRVASTDLRWMHIEKLESHNGTPAYSRAQGET